MAFTRTTGTPREAIVDAAVQLFGEKGYAATSMRDVAAAVGVRPSSLYAHIEGKETLLMEIVESAMSDSLDALRRAAGSSQPPEERLRQAIVSHVMAVAENPKRVHVLAHQWRHLTGRNRTKILRMRREYEQSFAQILRHGVASGAFTAGADERLTIFTLLGALNWTTEWLSPQGSFSAQALGDRMADVLTHGISAHRRQ
jgi:AcrR family transcriptional regulator